MALIPIGAILYVSAVQLGASSLQDLALAQFVGMAAGVYSSVFIAPRVLVQLKSSENEVKRQDRRAKARAKAQADRYASVPAFTDDLPVRDDPDEIELERRRSSSTAPRPGRPRARQQPSGGDRSRSHGPPTHGPVRQSAGLRAPAADPAAEVAARKKP